jgi:hypothetical protein
MRGVIRLIGWRSLDAALLAALALALALIVSGLLTMYATPPKTAGVLSASAPYVLDERRIAPRWVPDYFVNERAAHDPASGNIRFDEAPDRGK